MSLSIGDEVLPLRKANNGCRARKSILSGLISLRDFFGLKGGIVFPIEFMNVSFNYPTCDFLFKWLNFGITLSDRIRIVGANGVGNQRC